MIPSLFTPRVGVADVPCVDSKLQSHYSSQYYQLWDSAPGTTNRYDSHFPRARKPVIFVYSVQHGICTHGQFFNSILSYFILDILKTFYVAIGTFTLAFKHTWLMETSRFVLRFIVVSCIVVSPINMLGMVFFFLTIISYQHQSSNKNYVSQIY